MFSQPLAPSPEVSGDGETQPHPILQGKAEGGVRIWVGMIIVGCVLAAWLCAIIISGLRLWDVW